MTPFSSWIPVQPCSRQRGSRPIHQYSPTRCQSPSSRSSSSGSSASGNTCASGRVRTLTRFPWDETDPEGFKRSFTAPSLVVDPVLLETGAAIALTRHFDPAGEEARGREQQTIAQMRRVVSVFFEG